MVKFFDLNYLSYIFQTSNIVQVNLIVEIRLFKFFHGQPDVDVIAYFHFFQMGANRINKQFMFLFQR